MNTESFSPYHFVLRQHPQMVINDRRLICPRCKEIINREDLEFFWSCPFCSYAFDKTEPLEDYLLEPQVDNWMRQQPGFSFQNLEPDNPGNI